MNDATAARAEEICAHLLVFPHVKRDRYRDLMLDEELRDEVQRRLGAVGLALAESFYSDHYAVRLKEEVEADVRFDWATNQRLPRGAVALIVVLWAKLVLPRRAARDRRVDPEDPSIDLFPEEKPVADFVVKVPKDAILAEFEARFGRSNVLRYIGMLKRLGFIREDRAGRLHEGPLLDLLVDGQRLATEIQTGVLWDLVGGSAAAPAVAKEPALEPTEDDGEDPWIEDDEPALEDE